MNCSSVEIFPKLSMDFGSFKHTIWTENF